MLNNTAERSPPDKKREECNIATNTKIRVTHIQFIDKDNYYMELSGPSLEQKPEVIELSYGIFRMRTGNLFLENDTGDLYSYDETEGWSQIGSLGGGT